MPIEFACPSCQRPYKVADSNAGKRFACKQCGKPVEVPAADTVLAAPPVAATDEPAQAAPALRAPARSGPRAAPPKAAGEAPAEAAPAVRAPARAGPRTAPYGHQPPAPGGPKTRAPNFIFLGGALGMTVGFFMPWISIDLYITELSMGGYELPGKFMDLVNVAAKYTQPGTDEYEQIQSLKTRGMFLYSMYLIPVLCLGAGIEELMAFKKARNFWWLRAIAAASPIIAFITVVIAFSGLSEGSSSSSGAEAGGSPFGLTDILGFGIWVSLLGFAAATAGIFTNPKPKAVVQPMMQRPRAPHPPGAPSQAPAPRPVGAPKAAASRPPGQRPVPRLPRKPQ